MIMDGCQRENSDINMIFNSDGEKWAVFLGEAPQPIVKLVLITMCKFYGLW